MTTAGAGNGLDHVRELFRVRFPPPWPHGFLSRIARSAGVDPELVHRIFREKPGWGSTPKDPLLAQIAKVLNCPIAVVGFAFMADLHPLACDEDIYAVLKEVGEMEPDELVQMRQYARKVVRKAN